MKRLVSLLVLFSLIFCMEVIASPEVGNMKQGYLVKTLRETNKLKSKEDLKEPRFDWYNDGSVWWNGYGSAGRLEIPSVGISVALYWTNLEDYSAQYLFDCDDSAIRYSDVLLIGDRDDQAFCTLSYVVPGTEATIYYPDGSYEDYVCVDCGIGYQEIDDIFDQYDDELYSFDYLTMYTGYYNWQTPFVCQWMPC